MRTQNHICPICNYRWETIYKGKDLKDDDGNLIHWRENCPNCNWTRKLSTEEIGLIVASAK